MKNLKAICQIQEPELPPKKIIKLENDESGYFCNYCGWKFKTIFDWIDNIKLDRGEEIKFRCQKCNSLITIKRPTLLDRIIYEFPCNM